MTTILNMPLRSFDEKTINELKKKYPEAHIRIEAEIAGRGFDVMTEDVFWSVIDHLDWTKEPAQEILSPAVHALSQFSTADIQAFHEIMAQKLFLLDGEKFAQQTGKSRLSADGFLYARCCVVANGRDFFNKVIADPVLMPKDFTFEPLLYLPEKAYRLKTGQDDYDYLPETWYETFSNAAGWPGRPPLKDQIVEGQ
jgi:hypothetical protein